MSLLTNPFFNVGMGLLANSGPSLTPVNPYRGIAEGLFNAQQGAQAEQESAYRQWQMEQQKQEAERLSQQRQYAEQMAASAPPELREFARAYPEQYAKAIGERLTAKPADTVQIKTAGEIGLQGYPPETPVEVKMSGGVPVDYNPLMPGGQTDTANIRDYLMAQEDPAFKQFLDSRQAPAPAFQFIGTPDGVVAGNVRTGGLSAPAMGANGLVMRAQDSPELQAEIAGGEAAARTTETARAQAAIDLPQAQATGEQTLGLVRALRDHPGLSGVVGLPDVLSAGGRVPGTPEADFRARLEQLQGQQFLQAYQSLKGAGQISEVEGTKAQNAVARMQTAQSEREFKKAADEFIEITEKAVERAKRKAGQDTGGWSIRKK